MILAGDVGGTKIHLALIADDGEPDHPSTEARLRTADVRELPQAVAAFAQASAGPIRAGVLGVAKPIAYEFTPEQSELLMEVGARLASVLGS